VEANSSPPIHQRSDGMGLSEFVINQRLLCTLSFSESDFGSLQPWRKQLHKR